LYFLRALEGEQQLDFTAAEADWKSFAEKSADKAAAQLSLADFYHRRLQPLEESRRFLPLRLLRRALRKNLRRPRAALLARVRTHFRR